MYTYINIHLRFFAEEYEQRRENGSSEGEGRGAAKTAKSGSSEGSGTEGYSR